MKTYEYWSSRDSRLTHYAYTMNEKEMRSKGGRARDAALSEEQKKEIARMGALARWGARPAKATHKGNFKEQFGIALGFHLAETHFRDFYRTNRCLKSLAPN